MNAKLAPFMIGTWVTALDQRVFGPPWMGRTVMLSWEPMFIAAGAITGLRVCWSIFLGSITAWMIFTPALQYSGIIQGSGYATSLARPGGNITGVSLMASALAGKSVELFRDMLPSVRRVGVLGHATNPVFAQAMLDEVRRAAGPTGTEIRPVVMVRGTDELETAFTTMVRERADALVVQGSLAIKPD